MFESDLSSNFQQNPTVSPPVRNKQEKSKEKSSTTHHAISSTTKCAHPELGCKINNTSTVLLKNGCQLINKSIRVTISKKVSLSEESAKTKIVKVGTTSKKYKLVATHPPSHFKTQNFSSVEYAGNALLSPQKTHFYQKIAVLSVKPVIFFVKALNKKGAPSKMDTDTV